MKKSDLRTGMRVEIANKLYVVLKDVPTLYYGNQEYLFASDNSFSTGDGYNEDFTHTEDIYYDITKIYDKPSASKILDPNICGELLWTRPTPKEMTIAEIEKELGYSVKIIKEDKQ